MKKLNLLKMLLILLVVLCLAGTSSAQRLRVINGVQWQGRDTISAKPGDTLTFYTLAKPGFVFDTVITNEQSGRYTYNVYSDTVTYTTYNVQSTSSIVIRYRDTYIGNVANLKRVFKRNNLPDSIVNEVQPRKTLPLPPVANGLTLANLEANMITVPGGSFTMGATSEQLTNNGDGFSVWWSPSTQQVTLSSYKICRFEVTQQLWLDVMGSNPSYFTGDLQRPVDSVSWNKCQAFITKLNQLTGKSYRLPTEAEWEYAARGGANSTYSYFYSGSNTINNVAWYSSNSGNTTHTVGTKQANALGIFDMSGNVREWCNDLYGDYSNTAVTNPLGANSGSTRVIRGGSWLYYGDNCRVSTRDNSTPSISYDNGLRLSL